MDSETVGLLLDRGARIEAMDRFKRVELLLTTMEAEQMR